MLLLHAVYVVAHVLSCLCYVGTKSLNAIQEILQDCLKKFLHYKTFANRVALEAGQQQRSNAQAWHRRCPLVVQLPQRTQVGPTDDSLTEKFMYSSGTAAISTLGV